MDARNPSFRTRVYKLVKLVPAGRVATYGQIASYLAEPRKARAVGNALSALRHGGEDGVPWQRIINAAGRISAPNDQHRYRIQKALLEAEGIDFDDTDRCALSRVLWQPQPELLASFTSVEES